MKKYNMPVFVAFFLMLTSSVIQAGTGDGHIDPGENELRELAKSTQNPVFVWLKTHQSDQGEAGGLEGTQDVGLYRDLILCFKYI